MADIFLSYARQERNDVMPIKVLVEKLGLSIFIDVEGLDAGEEFPARLQREIESSRLVLACWSPLALSRPWVRTECAAAKAQGKLFPIQIKPITEYDMIVAFADINYIDLTDFLSATAHEKTRNFVGVLSRRLSEPHLVETFERLSRAEVPAAKPANAYEAELEIRLRQYREIFEVLNAREEVGAMETLLDQVTKFAPGMGLEILFRLDIERLRKKVQPSLHAPTVVEAPGVEERLRRSAAIAEASKQVSREPAATPDPILAKAFPGNRPLGLQHVRKLMELSSSTCQIWRIDQQNSLMTATGFLIEGHLLEPDWGPDSVVVTANHVISTTGLASAKLPTACFARFPGDGETPVDMMFGDILHESEPDRHDVTVIRLRGTLPSFVKPLSALSETRFPARGADEAGIGRVYVIGFPGGELAFSMADNVLLDHDEDVQPLGEPVHLHYRTPTQAGSSGSPIFDGLSLQLVGLHHKGSPSMARLKPRTGAYAANEGISIKSIREDIRRRRG